MPLSTSVATRLEYQHKSLVDLIDGLSDEQIRRLAIPGKWSIFENIVHLVTYQRAFVARLHKMLSEDNAEFARYVAESDPLFFDNCSKPTGEIMKDLITTRRKIIDNIQSLTIEQTQRTGTHPVFGKMNVGMWLHFFLLHEAHHLFTIFKLAPLVREQRL